MITILIDPGHDAWTNRSPICSEYVEGIQMWKLAQHLIRELYYYGVKGICSRPDIVDAPTHLQRAEVARREDCRLVLSLHSNAADPTITGTELFYSLAAPEMKVLCDRLGGEIAKLMGHHFRGSKTRAYSEGSNVDYYAILRHCLARGCQNACIIEHGFHTNLKDAQWLMEDRNLHSLAETYAQVIGEFYGLEKHNKENPQTGAFSR